MIQSSMLKTVLLASTLTMVLGACSADPNDDKKPFIIVEFDDGTADMGQDMKVEDMPKVDMKPKPAVADNPKGNVYLKDPVNDSNKTTEVTLPRPDNDAGMLTNEAVRVLNCINEKGEPLSFQGFMVGNLCTEQQNALPAADGHYLHITPPPMEVSPDDVFAEVQMYYHVNQIRDYLVNEQKVQGLNRIDAITNVQLYTNELASMFLGRPPGWFPFDNAAYFFPASFEQVGLPKRDEGAIVFGQGTRVDFSYDAGVIYHEFTHSMIGPNRLNGTFPDEYGLNNTPGAINEAVADYFAGSLLEDPVIGRYGLAAFGPDKVRDLSKVYSCPDDLSTEIHDDGRIIGSYLFAVRGELGKEATDRVILGALNSTLPATGFDQFVDILISTAKQESVMAETVFKRIGEERGLVNCERAVEWTNWTATSVPISVLGTGQFMNASFPQGIPGYFQHWLKLPEGKVAKLTWTMQASQAGAASLELALAKDEHLKLQVRSNGASVTAENFVKNIPSTMANQSVIQSVTLGANCLTGTDRTYIMFLNQSQGGANIIRRQVEFIDAATATDVHSCETTN